MVEKDEYDRAWERREAAELEARRLNATRPAIRRGVQLTAAILLGLGLLLVALGLESLATLDACIADPACLPTAWDSAFQEFFVVLAVGIVLAVCGVVQLGMRLPIDPRT